MQLYVEIINVLNQQKSIYFDTRSEYVVKVAHDILSLSKNKSKRGHCHQGASVQLFRR